jgi:hypothetical protein
MTTTRGRSASRFIDSSCEVGGQGAALELSACCGPWLEVEAASSMLVHREGAKTPRRDREEIAQAADAGRLW